jgi:hypothetical protein
MIRRERISYFDTQKFGGRIRCKNEEWANFGVKSKPIKFRNDKHINTVLTEIV